MKLGATAICLAAILTPQFGSPADLPADPLIGRWIRIANNADNKIDASIEFRLDSTAVYVYKDGPPQTWRYRREPVKEWLKRRPAAHSHWTEPGVETITFADPKTGVFQDSGGWVLQLVPQHRVLINPITQAWCRPGEEARVRKLLGI